MRRTAKHPRLLFLLWPASIWVFVILVALWVAVWALVPPESWVPYAPATRLCGYLATVAMLVPYLHILRRGFRHRRWGASRSWLWWHIAAAYAAFFLVLLHSRAQAHSVLTLLLVL